MVLQGHEAAVTSAAFSPDGAQVVTASEDRTARLWDAASGKELAVLQGHEDGLVGGVQPGRGRGGDRVCGWHGAAVGRGERQGAGGAARPRGWVSSAAFSPDGAAVVTASEDARRGCGTRRAGKELAVLQGHEGPVWSAAFSPDGARW